jgi:hypothetical protein
LVSVIVGLGLAVAYYAVFLWFQHLVARLSSALQPAAMIAGMVLRLILAAAVLVPIALYTGLNFIAVAAAFAGFYTILSIWGIQRSIARAKRTEKTSAPGAPGGVVGR